MFKLFHKHKKAIVKNGQDLFESFQKRRKLLLRLSLFSFGLTFLALAIVGLKLFYPLHMVIGIGIYIISFVPLGRRIYLSRQTWKTYRAYSWSASFFKKERGRLLVVIMLVVVTTTFFWLRPLDDKPFDDLTYDQISQLVADDLYQSVTAMDYLETSGNELLVLLESGREDPLLNEDVAQAFSNFLEAVAFSETLTERHRYFASIPYRLWGDRVSSFLISYSLYVKKYELVHRIMTSVSGNEYLKKVLNQEIEGIGQGNLYNDLVNFFYKPKTGLRLNSGYLYSQIFAQPNNESADEFSLLYLKMNGSYRYLKHNFIDTVFYSGELVTDNVEQKVFDTWFPIQKTVATGMGRAILTTRGKDGLITTEQALVMREVMQPGDIMLQRRNWHVSNVGIPGFWTHSALYTGDLETMDEYFASEFPYLGYEKMSAYLEGELPAVYKRYLEPDKDGQTRAVIEAIEPGVVLQSLPVSADADFVVALRANVTKHDKLLAAIRAMGNFGKPYDFDFDFDTRDSLVCSELIYDAYLEDLPEKHGLHFETSLLNGRKVVSPLDMANKFVAEYGTSDQSMSYVYMLKGDETTQTAVVGTKKDFLDSVNWSKFSFLQE